MAIKYYFTSAKGGETRLTAFSDKTRSGETHFGWYDSSLPKPEDERHPMAVLQMNTSREIPNFDVTEPTGISYDHEIEDPDNPPTELFQNRPPQITGAYTDPSLRHVLPTMVGLSLHRMGASNAPIMADYQLTPYSSALSQRAARKGLAVADPRNPEMKAGGEGPDYSEMSSQTMSIDVADAMRRRYEEESPHDVQRARLLVRNRLGKEREVPKKMGPQFDQLRLDI